MKLYDVKLADTFKVAGIEFIKITNDGDKVIAVAKDVLFNSIYGENGNYAESKVKEKLEKELLPKLEKEIGEENILSFETDLTALDGTKPYENVNSKVGLVTLDFYRQNREVFEKYNPNQWWWLSTPDSVKYNNVILCVAPSGMVFSVNCYGNYGGVRPILRFVSSISVSCED